MHCAIFDLDVGVRSFHFLDDRVHRFVRYISHWMSEVVSKHQNYVFGPINTSCIDCMIVGYLDELVYVFPNIVLQHRHPVSSIKKIEFAWR